MVSTPSGTSVVSNRTTFTGWLTRCRARPPTLMPWQLDSRVQASDTSGRATNPATRSVAWTTTSRSRAPAKLNVISATLGVPTDGALHAGTPWQAGQDTMSRDP